MGKSFLGDIPGARFHEAIALTHAAVASAGANARLGQVGPFAHDIRVRNGWWTPLSADDSASSTASYRRLDIVNGGPAGTITTSSNRVATLGLTATHASLGPVAMVVVDATGTTETIAAGNVLYFSQSTVGGADSTHTVLPTGQFALAYEVL